MAVSDVRLHPNDAVESAELLQFLDDRLTSDHDHNLDASLTRFAGSRGYDLSQLRTDLGRFAFLLGANDGARLFGND
ncbi:MAG TPA: hypothetical protein VGL46_14310 [Pseudonocardiaceae bacterium]|jgi:hypothetical protein